jgi:hypothetical protein
MYERDKAALEDEEALEDDEAGDGEYRAEVTANGEQCCFFRVIYRCVTNVLCVFIFCFVSKKKGLLYVLQEVLH